MRLTDNVEAMEECKTEIDERGLAARACRLKAKCIIGGEWRLLSRTFRNCSRELYYGKCFTC